MFSFFSITHSVEKHSWVCASFFSWANLSLEHILRSRIARLKVMCFCNFVRCGPIVLHSYSHLLVLYSLLSTTTVSESHLYICLLSPHLSHPDPFYVNNFILLSVKHHTKYFVLILSNNREKKLELKIWVQVLAIFLTCLVSLGELLIYSEFAFSPLETWIRPPSQKLCGN